MDQSRTLRKGAIDIQSEEDYDEDLDEYASEEDEAAVAYPRRRTHHYIDIDQVSLSETPRSERIKNALENPTITMTDERASNVPRSNFFTRGIERSYGSA